MLYEFRQILEILDVIERQLLHKLNKAYLYIHYVISWNLEEKIEEIWLLWIFFSFVDLYYQILLPSVYTMSRMEQMRVKMSETEISIYK